MEIKNKKWERLPLLVMLLFCVSAISAQKITISGKVTDEMKDPIIGATVSVKGDNTAGTITDLDVIIFWRLIVSRLSYSVSQAMKHKKSLLMEKHKLMFL